MRRGTGTSAEVIASQAGLTPPRTARGAQHPGCDFVRGRVGECGAAVMPADVGLRRSTYPLCSIGGSPGWRSTSSAERVASGIGYGALRRPPAVRLLAAASLLRRPDLCLLEKMPEHHARFLAGQHPRAAQEPRGYGEQAGSGQLEDRVEIPNFYRTKAGCARTTCALVIGRSARESLTQPAFRVVSNSLPAAPRRCCARGQHWHVEVAWRHTLDVSDTGRIAL